MFCKKGVLRNFAKFTENTYARVSFLISCRPQACNFIKSETLAQVFSCEFCEISKITFFYRTPLVAACLHSFRAPAFINFLKLRYNQDLIIHTGLHKKWSFASEISSVNVTKFTVSSGCDHIS